MFETEIRILKARVAQAVARRNMQAAQFYGERLSAVIRLSEANGEYNDGRQSAFSICKGVR